MEQALCIIVSLYVIFELQFGIHNGIIQLLYGILVKQSGALTKPLRNSQNQTTATNIGDKDLINAYSSESSDSSSLLSSIDPPLVIHISLTKEQQRQIASSSSSNDNTLCEVNIKQQVSATSTDRSSTISNKKNLSSKKRS
ncbi:unnamed protein product [Adineta steineri]|nr:unnamed protein product [Adineta steineri]